MKTTSFGEILWDCLPNGKVLGGAPLNVAARLAALGADACVISRCGADENGEELLRQTAKLGVSTRFIQTCAELPTSQVKVILDGSGSAHYDIVYPCAWDNIRTDEAAVARVAESDALIFGSLAARDARSRQTLHALLPHARFKVFDVNLRAPHYTPERVRELMEAADLVKLNDDELFELAATYGSPYRSIGQNARFLADLCGIPHLCITLGSHGALYYRNGLSAAHQGFRVDVADTVGAGDSFLAGFVFRLLQGAEPPEILEFACALGALAASKRGATAAIGAEETAALICPARSGTKAA